MEDDSLFTDCRIFHEGEFKKASILINTTSGKIKEIIVCPKQLEELVPKTIPQQSIIPCNGCILSPGFVDIQINGSHGVDFSSPTLTENDVVKVAKSLPQYGVTSFCPTIISSSREIYRRNIGIINRLCRQQNYESGQAARNRNDQNHPREEGRNVGRREVGGAKILGLHLEGPFFAKSKKGAHDAQVIQETVNMSSLSNTYSSQNFKKDNIKIITMAPELPGSLSTIQILSKEHDVVVSMGHTDATFLEGMNGLTHGASLITHLFNAMKPFHHREPGLLGLIQSNAIQVYNNTDSSTSHGKNKQEGKNDNQDHHVIPTPYFSIIVDGLHAHPATVKMAHSLNPSKIVLVTDAMSAMGLGIGTHSLGSMSVNIENNKATISGTDTLAGSIVSMDTCVKNLKQFTGCTINDALIAASLHPAKVLKLEKYIGSLCVGSYADLVLLDNKLNIVKTWINGELVHEKCNARKRKNIS